MNRSAGSPTLMHQQRSPHPALRVFFPQVVIHSLADAHEQIDKAISAALFHSKPAYICVSCNLAGGTHTLRHLPVQTHWMFAQTHPFPTPLAWTHTLRHLPACVASGKTH